MAMRRVRSWVAGGLLLGAGGMAAAGGCGAGEYDCAEEVTCEIVNANGTSNGHCWGQCVYPPGGKFGEPMLVWTGPKTLAPSCEDLTWVVPGTDEIIRPSSGTPKLLGRALPRVELHCPTCACTVPSCALPSDVTAVSLAMCGDGPAETRTPFAAPPGWDGACVSPGWGPPEQLGSLLIGSIIERPCEPVVEESPVPRDAVAGEVAIACPSRVSTTLCAQMGQTCLVYQQQNSLPEAWRQCVSIEGLDTACEAPAAAGDPWPRFSEKLAVFSKGVEDTRACTPCTCKPPATSRCEAFMSAYMDSACSDWLVGISVTTQEVCVDPGPAPMIGSLSATWIVNEPGRCTPEGGVPDGAREPEEPVTICCLPRER
ncbi:hypothetical protein [Sorangium sp. So ce1151]|uniref:hypothetical protein n=1 Tax=Sorangium sp. So ce1151 TaxID=3133332 RepID=UPI003F617B7B